MKSILISLSLLLVSALSATAQTAMASDEISSESKAMVDIDDSFFLDQEEKVCYIDLEKIPVNLKQAALINKEGNEVYVKSLTDERVDTIVELDYSDLPGGSYVLELRSYTGTTAKAIQL